MFKLYSLYVRALDIYGFSVFQIRNKSFNFIKKISRYINIQKSGLQKTVIDFCKESEFLVEMLVYYL